MSLATAPLPADLQNLRLFAVGLQAELARKDIEIAANAAEIHAKSLHIEKLKAQLAVLRRARFGRSSEKLDRDIEQLELLIGELEEETAEADARTDATDPTRNDRSRATRERRQSVRKPLPPHLPRETVTHEPACACPGCGGTVFSRVGQDERELLEYVPSSFKVIRHVRPKLSCRACETIVQEPMPALPIERGRPGPGLIAHVLVSKYCDHTPLHRQALIYAREGVELDRSTLADWVGSAVFLLSPLAEAIGRHIRAGAALHADDTTVPVLAPGLGRTKTGRGSNQGNTQNEKSLYHQSSIDFRCYLEMALFEPRRYQCCRAQIDYAASLCQAFPIAHLDHAAGELFLEAVRPAAIETTLAALAVLERERQALDRHWQLRIERARYEVQRAQRQYDAIEPENRLVARSLETRWNTALQALEQLEQEYAVVRRTELLPLDEAEQRTVRDLAADLPALWRAATTTDVDRKRLLRLVITEVVLTVDAKERRAEVTIVWSGGATTQHEVRCPPLGWHGRTEDRVVARLRELAQELPDHRIAERLNAAGLRTRTGKAWTYARVYSMRKQHGIATACPLHTREAAQRADGLVPVTAAAQRLGVSPSLVHLWVQHGVLAHDQRRSASRVWVRLDADDLIRLDGSSPLAPHLPSFGAVMQAERLSVDALWERVRHGEYRAFRAQHGQCWEWRLQRSPAPDVGCDSEEPAHHE